MSKQDILKTQTCVLRVNIDCDGCKSKVKRTLQKIDDVYVTSIDMQQGKVTVTGNVDPAVLIKKLEKSGKHAVLVSTEKGNSNKNKKGDLDNVNDQLKKLLQVGNNGKGGGDDFKKFQQKGEKEQQKGGMGDGKNLQQINFQQFLEQMKSGSKDFTMKDQKPAVKVNNLPGKDDGHDFGDFSGDDEFDDEDDYDDEEEFDEEDDEFDEEEEDDYDDEDEEEDGDDEDEEEELGYDDGKHHKQQKIAMPIMVNDLGKDKKGSEKGKKDGGDSKKKNGGIMSMIGKAMGGSNDSKSGDKKPQGVDGKNNGGSPKDGGEGKKGKKGGGGGGDGGKKDGGGGKNGGGFKDVDVPNHKQMGQQFPAAPMMNMNGGGSGYYQGMGSMGPVGPMPGNPYQQQQYMAMMMNQQRMNGGGMYHPAMYGRPPPGYGYMPPPVYHDHVTHMFSDENPGSCSIM